MKTVWLHNKKRSRLILFCNGWGMDEYPFFPLGSDNYDVLIIYDYLDLQLDLDLDSLFKGYFEVVLIGWSMGVWAGQKLFAKVQHRFTKTMAINGTLAPIDDHLGIPCSLFTKTYNDYNEVTNHKFYRRMCREKANLDRFIANKPHRSLESRKSELGSLLDHAVNIPLDQSIYTDIIVADKDFVVPTRNQLQFWQKKHILRLDGYHFLFYGWRNWDELVENPDMNTAKH